MKRSTFLLLIILSGFSRGQAQNIGDAVKDSLKEVGFQATMSYPYIKSNKAAGVLPVTDIEEKQDPALRYKLIFPLGSFE